MAAWLLGSSGGLALRIALGICIFAALAIVDLRRHGRAARRWREYLFLLGCVAAAMLYGIINDQLTALISWEYFYYGKGLDEVLGPAVPPQRLALQFGAAMVGVKATWSAGLIMGACLLLANNPSPARPALRFGELGRLLPLMLVGTATVAALFGAAGHFGLLVHLNPDLRAIWDDNLFRPARFLAVYGIHLGGYIGGALMTVVAVITVRRRRRQQVAAVAAAKDATVMSA